jgi:hypothetical protein
MRLKATLCGICWLARQLSRTNHARTTAMKQKSLILFFIFWNFIHPSHLRSLHTRSSHPHFSFTAAGVIVLFLIPPPPSTLGGRLACRLSV